MFLDASSLTIETKDEVVIYDEDNSITLNCTYYKNNTEEISNRNIKWKKHNGTVFNDVATFSPPGGAEPFIEKDMKSLYINRTELIAPDSYLAAVIIINKPVCSDEGIYQCWIQYFSEDSTKHITSTLKVTFKGKILYYITSSCFIILNSQEYLNCFGKHIELTRQIFLKILQHYF